MILELVQIFIDNIAPILIIAAIGFTIGRRFGIEPKPVSTIIFYILSPCLVFISLYTSEIDGGEFLTLFLLMIVLQIILALFTYALFTIIKVDSVKRANVIVGSFCMNTGNFGLSLIDFAFGPAVFSRAIIIYVAATLMNYSLGVFVSSNGRSSAYIALRNILKTPAVYGVGLAFMLRIFQLELPLIFERSAQKLADGAIPMMLIMLGLQLGQFQWRGGFKLVSLGVVIKLLISPIIAFILVTILDIDGLTRTAFIVQASMPTAVMTLLLANEFDTDRDLALNLIMVSTLLSPFTLSILILLFQ